MEFILRKLVVILLFSVCAALQAKDNALVGVKVFPLPDSRVRFDFQFAQPIEQLPASFITQKPPRLVLDFINTTNQLAEDIKSQSVNMDSLIHYTILAVANRVRAVLDLAGPVSYSGQVANNIYSLIIHGKSPQLIPPKTEIFVTHRNVNARHGISNIDFRGTDKQGGRVIIDVSDPGIPIDVTQRGKDMVVNFLSTSLPVNLMKRYDVTDFHTPVQMMLAEQEGKNARLVLVNKGDYGHFAYQVNKQFIIDVFPLSPEDIQQQQLKKRVFSGKRISLNFQDISLRAVLQLLADFTGVNMVVSDAVTGNITLRLNDIPWDQALDIILTTQGLDKRQTDNVIMVDKAAAFITRENNELKEHIAAQKLAPLRSDLLQINYAKAADIATMLKDKNTSLLSDRGNLSVDTRTNTIWLQDTGEQIEEVRELVKQLDIPVKQVLIEARIVDLTRNSEEDLGIRFGVSRPQHLSGTLNGANTLATLGPQPSVADIATNVVPISDRLNVDLAAAPVAGQAAALGIALAKLGNGVLLDLELSALESEGCAEIIASPRLMTTNQQAAVIESGKEIPYQESTSSGATSVAFKKAVLSLKVTPQITPDGKLLMDLEINQDADSGERVQGVPIILTKQIQTSVLVNNGQTIVLGGIYQQDKSNNVRRVPFLGQIPLVGSLFREKHTALRNEELLIFITPRIITNNLSITTVDGQPQVSGRKVEVGPPPMVTKPVEVYK